MGCAACGQQRQSIAQQYQAGNAMGTFRAVTLGAKMIAEKMVGVDINAKYGASSNAPPPDDAKKVYTRT